jgi:hypothetical protein
MNKEIKISLEGMGLTFKGETSFEKATKILQFISNDSDVDLRTNSQGQNTVNSTNIAIDGDENRSGSPNFSSPIEAVKSSSAKTYPQKIAVLGYYLSRREKSETFDPKQIQSLLRRMGDTPALFSRDLRNAADLHNFIVAEPNGDYLVTDAGIEAIKNQFETSENTTRKKPRRKKTKTK